ncbi:hypothetical protein TNCV_4227801 [Trichonephila clavipes]|nr:hypothetical protein TNCV_4227801 [Trichonephila clavipes]
MPKDGGWSENSGRVNMDFGVSKNVVSTLWKQFTETGTVFRRFDNTRPHRARLEYEYLQSENIQRLIGLRCPLTLIQPSTYGMSLDVQLQLEAPTTIDELKSVWCKSGLGCHWGR